mmetsp:Transcript_10666/g.27711  ORF Transcript_10666/g.27711 Transcript_10666/m.27711 type:complete len:213 (+) Transcript_10666:1004-1642(+)
MQQLLHTRAKVDLHAALSEVVHNRLVQVRGRRALAHAQHGRLRADREELEDGEHAACRDVVAVNEAKGVRDWIPQPLDRAARAARALEPLGEGHVVQVAHAVHPAIKVDERLHDRARDRVAERERVRDLVANVELRGRCERLQAVHGSADAAHAEVELADGATAVDEDVPVILEPQAIVERTHALHDAEEVVVAAKEDVQTHLDVVAIFVDP